MCMIYVWGFFADLVQLIVKGLGIDDIGKQLQLRWHCMATNPQAYKLLGGNTN